MSNYLPILFNLIRILTPVPHFFEVCESAHVYLTTFLWGKKGVGGGIKVPFFMEDT